MQACQAYAAQAHARQLQDDYRLCRRWVCPSLNSTLHIMFKTHDQGPAGGTHARRYDSQAHLWHWARCMAQKAHGPQRIQPAQLELLAAQPLLCTVNWVGHDWVAQTIWSPNMNKQPAWPHVFRLTERRVTCYCGNLHILRLVHDLCIQHGDEGLKPLRDLHGHVGIGGGGGSWVT